MTGQIRFIATGIIVSAMVAAAAMGLPSPALGIEDLGERVKEFVNRKWTPDFDEMVEKKVIRALVPYSKTFYFLDGATPRGAAYDFLRLFEDHLNKKLKTRHLKVHVVIVPAGKGLMKMNLYRQQGRVRSVEQDCIAEAVDTPNDPYFSMQWGMSKVEAPQA